MAVVGISASPVRVPVKAISTSNLTLSGTQTVDTVALVAGDLCGALGQSNSKNGVYIVQAGAWLPCNPGIGTGLEVYATGGSANVNAVYGADTTGAIVWGTTSVTFTLKSAGGGAITGGVITATTEMITPTIGPDGTHQHTLPAVASGQVLVSGASAIPDGTLSLGDHTHRLVGLGVEAIHSGSAFLQIDNTIADGASATVLEVIGQAYSTGGSSILQVANNGAGGGVLCIGSPSGQSDALCYAEVLTCSGTVTAGQVVVWAGSKQVAAAAASAGLTTIAGVALTGGTATQIVVARRGRCYANADAGSTAGQLLKTSGAVAGNVVNGGTAVGSIVGRACEASGGTISGKILVDLTLS